jgi:hypothetical protein
VHRRPERYGVQRQRSAQRRRAHFSHIFPLLQGRAVFRLKLARAC